VKVHQICGTLFFGLQAESGNLAKILARAGFQLDLGNRLDFSWSQSQISGTVLATGELAD